MRTILHIDFNSYFATVEQQANPRLRGKPIGVTGGDRMERTVLGAASVEAKRLGVKTGMPIWEAQKLCPDLILVRGDSDKYLECTKRFLNILKDYSPKLEVFSIDEVFLETESGKYNFFLDSGLLQLATQIKSRIRSEIGEWITCSVGISYNKLMAKLAGSLYKPDGLAVIADETAAMVVLDRIELDEICGIGPGIKKRLNNMGVFSFKALRGVPLDSLLASFKSYGQTLYNMARGIDNTPLVPFYEKEEVKSIGHRHTLDQDTGDLVGIKQALLKLAELVARRLRAKRLAGKTIHLWYRSAFQSQFHPRGVLHYAHPGGEFAGGGMQTTIPYTNDGLEIFQNTWRVFLQIWDREKIRMVGVSVSNLKSESPKNLSLLEEDQKNEQIMNVLDKINDRFGEFTLERAALLSSPKVCRKPNPFLSDRRFKLSDNQVKGDRRCLLSTDLF
ncbi:DNA polymerase IV [Candidatus Daviesbacteria bacterium]|nr:DNA polymerase IV [Candidatus Daviesbacteria bacterium]